MFYYSKNSTVRKFHPSAKIRAKFVNTSYLIWMFSVEVSDTFKSEVELVKCVRSVYGLHLVQSLTISILVQL